MTLAVDHQRADFAISTHTLRKEGDYQAWCLNIGDLISTHTLRKEGDIFPHADTYTGVLFQPTPSARRVTPQPLVAALKDHRFQPTPSARRVTLSTMINYAVRMISTHTLRKEGD